MKTHQHFYLTIEISMEYNIMFILLILTTLVFYNILR